jgi:glycosyltransferase involved in cell wall biosynthesis
MKSVLVVSYYFPPLGLGSVHRTLKFVKELPANGWQPVVLSVSNPLGPRDPDLEREIPPGTPVFRVPYFEPSHLRAIFRAPQPGGRADAGAAAAPAPRSALRAAVRRAVDAVLDNVLVPDRQVTWALPAVPRGVSIVRRMGIDAIYSSYNPGTCHLIAGALKRLCAIPWVADFRDPWLRALPSFEGRNWRAATTRRLERWTMRRCDHLTAVSPQIIQAMRADHGLPDAPNATVIANGVDLADYDGLAARRRHRFTLAYVGTVYPDRDPQPVFQALGRLVRNGWLPADGVEFRFVGTLPAAFHAAAVEAGLGRIVTVTGHVGHRAALEEMAAADLLIMTVSSGESSRGLLSIKAFEYLAVGRRILYVGPPSPAGDVFRGADGADVVDNRDIDGIERSILAAFEDRAGGATKTFDRRRLVQPWTRSALATTLAKVLDEVTQQRRGRA